MTILVLVFTGFIGGLLLTSRALAWLLNVRAALRPPAGAAAKSWLVPLLLHSAPWLLLAASFGVRYVASLGRSDLLWALIGGAAAALVFVLAVTRRATTKPRSPPPPLTPERLVQMRREFTLGYMSALLVLGIAGVGYSRWDTLDHDYPLIFAVVPGSLLSGYLGSLIMWEWKRSLLEVAEKRRRQHEARQAAANASR